MAKIVKFKQWFQIQVNGYTVAQYLHQEDAREHLMRIRLFPAFESGVELQNASNKRGQSMKRIRIYP